MPVTDRKLNTKGEQLLTQVELIAVPLGVHPDSVMVQAYHETGGFKRIIGWNNFWGIKTPNKIEWDGKKVEVPTWEWFLEENLDSFITFYNKNSDKVFEIKRSKTKKGSKIIGAHLLDEFCDWYLESEALKYWIGLIKRVYPLAWVERGNPDEFYKKLVSGKYKWATDPEYPENLINLRKNISNLFIKLKSGA